MLRFLSLSPFLTQSGQLEREFVVVELLSHIQLFATPWTAAEPGFPALHYFPQHAQSHVHQVGDAIQASHSLSSPSPAFNLSQHQGLQGVSTQLFIFVSFSWSRRRKTAVTSMMQRQVYGDKRQSNILLHDQLSGCISYPFCAFLNLPLFGSISVYLVPSRIHVSPSQFFFLADLTLAQLAI